MDFGLCSFVYRWTMGRPYHRPASPMTVEGFVKRARFYGMAHVLLCNNCELENYSVEKLQQLKKLLDGLGVRADVGSRGVDTGYFRKILEAAKILDAKVMRLAYDIDRAKGPNSILAQLAEAKKCIRELLPVAKDAGISIAIENGRNMKLTEIRDLVLRIDDPNVGTCVDTMNSVSDLERPENVIDVLGPYAKMVHFKDWEIVDNKRGNVLTGRALGDGVVDFPGLYHRLKALGYDGSIFLELYVDHRETEEETYEFEDLCVRRSLDYAKKIGILA